jgi:hypothetical protein
MSSSILFYIWASTQWTLVAHEVPSFSEQRCAYKVLDTILLLWVVNSIFLTLEQLVAHQSYSFWNVTLVDDDGAGGAITFRQCTCNVLHTCLQGHLRPQMRIISLLLKSMSIVGSRAVAFIR